MTTQFLRKSSRVAAIAMLALMLVTTTGARVAVSATVTGGASGGSYVTANEQYGIGLGFGVRTGGDTAPTNDVHTCATSGSTCLEP